jgi:hypothetical protein
VSRRDVRFQRKLELSEPTATTPLTEHRPDGRSSDSDRHSSIVNRPLNWATTSEVIDTAHSSHAGCPEPGFERAAYDRRDPGPTREPSGGAISKVKVNITVVLDGLVAGRARARRILSGSRASSFYESLLALKALCEAHGEEGGEVNLSTPIAKEILGNWARR